MMLPILGVGIQGRSPNVSAQNRLNMYLEFHQIDRDKTAVSAHPTPGLVQFADLGDTPARGMYATSATYGEFLYVVHRNTFYRINNAGVVEAKGVLLTSTGRVGISDNGSQIMVVDGLNGYIYTLSTEIFVRITDVDFPGADTVTFLDQFFIVNPPNSGKFYVSALLDGLNWNALAFSTAESNPDNLIRVISERSILYLCGQYSTEAWANTGALDFPFSRLQGGSVEWGLAARYSMAKFDDSLCWLARNRLGQVSVVRSVSLDVSRVSTPDLDYLFSTYGDTANATALSYMLNGHPMYEITFPSVSNSWLYDGSTSAWSKVESTDAQGRHRSDTQANFLEKIMVSDYLNGKIYRLIPDIYTDNGAMIVREIVGPHFFMPNDQASFVSEIRLDMETGLGLSLGQGSNPQIMLSLSRDGGHSFGNERWATAGKTGQYSVRARWRRFGRMRRDMVPKIRFTEPIPLNIVKATVDYEQGIS